MIEVCTDYGINAISGNSEIQDVTMIFSPVVLVIASKNAYFCVIS